MKVADVMTREVNLDRAYRFDEEGGTADALRAGPTKLPLV